MLFEVTERPSVNCFDAEEYWKLPIYQFGFAVNRLMLLWFSLHSCYIQMPDVTGFGSNGRSFFLLAFRN